MVLVSWFFGCSVLVSLLFYCGVCALSVLVCMVLCLLPVACCPSVSMCIVVVVVSLRSCVYCWLVGCLLCVVVMFLFLFCGVAQVVFAFWVCVFGVCFGVAGCGGVFWVLACRSF